MRIIQLCTSESLGGLELYFASCCKELKARNHDILAVVGDSSKLHQILMEDVNHIETPKNLVKLFFKLKKSIEEWRPDLIHVHHKKDLLLTALLRRFSKVSFKYVHTRQMDLPRSKKNVYHSFIYRSMDLIIAITDRLKDQIIERISVNPHRVIRLYYGVPLIAFKRERCDEIGVKPKTFNIGVIARIDRKKEQHVIIEAAALLKERKKDFKVYLVGSSTDDAYLSELNQLIRKKALENVVTLTGFIENPQELMPCFDVMVLTTGNETFGLVLPEAMRMGVPVIGADGGGVPEIIVYGETGLMFKPGDAEDLSQKIEIAMEKDLSQRLAENGKRYADQRFDLDRHFDNLESHFARTLV